MCSVFACSLDARTKGWTLFTDLKMQVDSLLKSLRCLMRLYQPNQKSPFKPEHFWKLFPKDLFQCEDSTYLSTLLLVLLSCMGVMETSRKSVSRCLQQNGKETLHSVRALSLFCRNCRAVWFRTLYSWKTDPFFLCYSRAGRVWDN